MCSQYLRCDYSCKGKRHIARPIFCQLICDSGIVLTTLYILLWGRHGRNCMVVGFITTYAISAYHHLSCEFKSHWWRGFLITFCYEVFQFSLGTQISSINKAERHVIAEILLKVALNTITQYYWTRFFSHL